MPSEAVNEATRREWRELGFFYDRDDLSKSWRIVGAAEGLLRFSRLVAAYSADSKHDTLSEHAHFGPYMYLELGTWGTPEITDHWIAGPLSSLAALAHHIESSIPSMRVGCATSVRSVFAPDAAYDLVLELRDDSFDPAREDAKCW